MSPRRAISARNVAIAALFLWVISLAPTGLVLYGGQRHLPGYEILATGWLSPLMLNFAWFANVFFLYGILRLLSGGTPIVSSAIATVLSLDTFRFDRLLLNEGGATTPVYGYGWGAILWFLSIFFMMAATGTRQRETCASAEKQGRYSELQIIGLVLLIVMLGTTACLAVYDRVVANPIEAGRLENIAFKRGKVCGAREPMASNPMSNLSGPVEVVIGKDTLHANYPFAQIKDLLAWGIPIVRVAGSDYSLDPATHNGSPLSVPATGATAATLYVNETYQRSISAKLVEKSTGRTVFDQIWERESHPVNTDIYCPDYISFPNIEQQPRKLLVQALNLHAVKAEPDSANQQRSTVFDRIDGTIVGQSSGGTTRDMKYESWKKMHPDSGFKVPYHEIFNTSCPSDVGWDGEKNESRQNTGWPFMVKGVAHYPGRRDRYNATCEGDVAYIYQGFARDGMYILNIEKRDLGDFRQIWAGIVVFSGIPPSTRDDVLKVQSVKKAVDGVTIDLVNEDSGHVFLVQAPLRDR